MACDNDGEAHILDAKYKIFNGQPLEGDMYQVVAYSRHENLLTELGSPAPDKITLSLVYPRLENTPNGKITEEKNTTIFHSKLKIQTVPCPVKPAE